MVNKKGTKNKLSKKTVDDKLRNFSIILFSIVACSIIGFIYEEIFYLFDYGKLVKRGTSFGPWVPIYGVGTLFILLFCNKKIKKHPLYVFIISMIVSIVVEYGIGAFLYNVYNLRIWDYNTEMWNWGNINGYICFRSIFLFSLGGLFIIYGLKPLIQKLANKMPKRSFDVMSIITGLIFILDVIIAFFIKIH